MANLVQNTIQTTTHAAGEVGVKGLFHAGYVPGGVGLTAVISAVLAQMEYKQKKEELKDLYKQELSAQLGKPTEQLTQGDFDTLANTNYTFNEHLVKVKKDRNLSMGVIAVGTIAAASVALFVIGMVAASTPVMTWLAATAIGMMTYGAIKLPLQKIGEKMFGVDKKTTHERIEKIYKNHQAGKVVAREQVFDVFVHANPPLDEYIKHEYGKSYDKLTPVDKMQITKAIGGQIGVEALTDAINQGTIRSTELAFAVNGKFSGVAPTLGDQPKPTLVGKMKEKIHHAADVIMHHTHEEEKPKISFTQRENARRAAQAANIQQGIN